MRPDEFHAVGTFTRYGDDFARRHDDGLGTTAACMGGVAVGMMRALLECDDCPGTFRRPLDPDWTRLYCPSCHGVWEKST